MIIPLPLGRGEQPTSVPVFGSRVNLRSVGPSAQSNAAALFPIWFPAAKARLLFSSDAVGTPANTGLVVGGTTAPVPSSNSVIENVFDNPLPCAVHASWSNSGTLIHRTLNAFT